MKKRNTQIQEFILPNQAKPLSARFDPKSHSVMVSGDDHNTISLWRLTKEHPIATLTHFNETGGSNNTKINSVCFSQSQNEVFSGNDEGVFTIWDIKTRRIQNTSKEHNSSIQCITPSMIVGQDNIVLTGSDDSTIKEWDLRQSASVATFNEHKMRINCISFSPDGQMFATGSADSLLKIWDMRTRKCLNTFNLHKSSISCAVFNPEEISLISASIDGSINYWDLKNLELMYHVDISGHPIQQIEFSPDGKNIFTAGQNKLRVWHVDPDALLLLDIVESGWNDIQDLVVQSNQKTGVDSLIGVAMTQSSLGLWESPFNALNRNYEKPLDEFENFQTQGTGEEEEEEEGVISDEMLQPQIRSRLVQEVKETYSLPKSDFANWTFQAQAPQAISSPSNDQRQNLIGMSGEFDMFNRIVSKTPENQENQDYAVFGYKPSGDINPPSLNEIDGQTPLDQLEKDVLHQAEFDEPQLEENFEFKELLESTKTMMDSLINIEKQQPSDLNYSLFLNSTTNDDKKLQLDTVSELVQEHSKFKATIILRNQNIRKISGAWRTGNALKTVPLIDKLGTNDPPMILSLITACVVAYRLDRVPMEVIIALLKKVPILLDTKLDLYIKVGLGFILTVFETFSKSIVPVKSGHTPKKPSLSKGEPPKKYAKLVNVFESISNQDSIRKLTTNSDSRIGPVAKKILANFALFIPKNKGDDGLKGKKKL